MPAYHEWVGVNGKPPSGTQWDEVLKVVLEAVWMEKERQRIARLVAKEKKCNEKKPPSEAEAATKRPMCMCV